MSAVIFSQGLSAALGNAAPEEAVRCVSALQTSGVSPEDFPLLAKLHRLAEGEYGGQPQGAFIIGCLRAGQPKVIHAWAKRIAPSWWKEKGGLRRAVSLHGDCYLALAEWITLWNRRQIKRVA